MRQIKVILALTLGLALVAVFAVAVPGQANTSEEFGWIRSEQIVVTTAGTNGSATASGTSDGWVRGHIYAVNITYDTDMSATTDVALTGTAPTLAILTKADSVTSAWYYPFVQVHGATASALTFYDRMPINSRIDVAVAQSTPSRAITVTVYWGQ